MNRRSILAAYKKKSSHLQTGVTGFKSGNLFKFVRYSAVLLGLVVLRTKARNRFCPMCTKECCIVLTRPNPFWGQFWGQISRTDSRQYRSNKCAALVSLQNWDTDITGFSQVKSPTSQYISFTLRQEVVRKYHAAAAPHTAPVAARNAPVCGSSQPIGAVYRPAKYRPKIPAFRGFFILPQRLLPRLDFPVQVNPTQINTK